MVNLPGAAHHAHLRPPIFGFDKGLWSLLVSTKALEGSISLRGG